jgi:hypothetical protein
MRLFKLHLSCLLLLLACMFGTANAGKVEVIPISGASPFDTCVADHPESQEGEVFLNSEVEPWVVVDPMNKRHIVAAWQQDRWSTGGARGIVTAVTFNGGLSWTQVTLPDLTPCTGNEEYIRASDPWLTFTPTGDLYHITLVVDEDLINLLVLGSPDEGRSAMLVQKSTDGGLTWSSPIAIVDETFDGLHDKETITADPFDGDVVYAVWDRFDFVNGGGPAMFSRTIDGAMTWEDPTVIYDPPNGQTLGNQIVVLPNGDILDFFSNIEFIDEESMEEIIFLEYKRSTDLGVTWTPLEPPVTVSSMKPSFSLADPDTGVPIRGGEELFAVAVDHKRGTLYAVWQDGRFGKELHESIAFSASEDGGLSWSPPIEINQTPKRIPVQNQQAFLPSVSVNAGGLVAITYYDFRFNDDGPGALTDMWAITCQPRKRRNCLDARDWREIRLTDESFDIGTAPLAGGLFLGDYEGLLSARNNFVAVFSVSSDTDPADVVFVRFNKGLGKKKWRNSVHARPSFHDYSRGFLQPQRKLIRARTFNTVSKWTKQR